MTEFLRNLMRDVMQKRRNYALFVGIPLLVCIAYFTAIASERYVSKALILVERDQQMQMPSLDLSSLFSTGAGSSRLDALVIQDFIESATMLDYLQGKLDLRAHYSQNGDFIMQMNASASKEDFLRYFRKRLRLVVDQESSVISLDVQAFDPDTALAIASAIVERAELFVNDISQQLAREQLAFVQGEIERNNERMVKASSELIRLQRQHAIFSPEAESATSTQIVAELQGELAKQRTEMKALSSYLNDKAPEMVTVRKRIAAFERQLEQERAKQVGMQQQGVNDLLVEYQAAQVAVKTATDIYQAAIQTLETTRLEASRKTKHLVRVSAPTHPDEAEFPHRLKSILTAFVFLNLFYFFATLILAAIRDHRD